MSLSNPVSYRPDIDGLRTIAVLSVVLYHFGFPVPGGFIGVDVFFVISGFLITSLLKRQIEQDSFSLSTFYARRIKRLLPALYVVLIASLAIFWSVLLPNDFVSFAKSLIYITIYLANIFFWREHGGYFATENEETPLLHTWSLAVEEQYYFVWPFILLFGYRFFSKQLLVALLATLLVFSIWFSEFATLKTIGAAYYLLPTRFFELLVGSLLAIALQENYRCPNKYSNLLSLTGLGLIIYSCFNLSANDNFPGYNAIPPTFGTAMIIFAGTNNRGFITKLLSTKSMVLIGLMSYSIYLWHWPIAVWSNYTALEKNSVSQTILLTLTLLASYLSWKLVETPLRKISCSNKQVYFYFLVIPALLTCVTAAYIIQHSGMPARFSERVNEMDIAINSLPNKERAGCHVARRSYLSLPSEDCWFGASGSQKAAFMLGDSYANHFSGFIDEIAKDASIAVKDYTMDSCAPLVNIMAGSNLSSAEQCDKRNKQALSHLLDSEENYSYVIFASNWSSLKGSHLYTVSGQKLDVDNNISAISEAYRSFLSELQSKDIKAIFIGETPSLKDHNHKCHIKNAIFNSQLDCQAEIVRNGVYSELISTLKNEFPEIISIEIKDTLCEQTQCKSQLGGIPLYRDKGHLNDIGARLISKEYLKSNPNPFEGNR